MACFRHVADLGPDLLIAVIGSALTVAIAFGTYVINRRLQEDRVLNSLITELSVRRALTPIADPRVVSGAASLADYQRSVASVLTIRDEVRRARDLVRPLRDFEKPLTAMTRACNRYLEAAAARPDDYFFLADALRAELWSEIQDLAKTRGAIHALRPGEGAF